MADQKIRNPRGAGRKRKLTPLEEANIYALYKNGAPPAEIAYKNNISPTTFQRIIRRFKEKEKEE